MVDYLQSRELVGQMLCCTRTGIVCRVLRSTVLKVLITNNFSPPEETPAAAAVGGGEARKNSTDELEAELEMDLGKATRKSR